MIQGINVDPVNPGGRPSPTSLRRLGATWIRLVSRDDPAIHEYVTGCRAAGVNVLSVLARESAGYILPDADMHQIGNEPDNTGASSWTRTPAEYIEDWRIYRETYPDLPMIAAGMASGDVTWWQQVGPHLQGCAAVAVHPYNKSATAAQTLLTAYRKVRPDLAVWVSEWFREPDQIVPFLRMLRSQSEAAFWFCSTDAMVPGMGLLGTSREQMWKAAA